MGSIPKKLAIFGERGEVFIFKKPQIPNVFFVVENLQKSSLYIKEQAPKRKFKIKFLKHIFLFSKNGHNIFGYKL